ncbi:MBL fold metallo-hydrolase [Candidatus Bipolaricaulota bacterium]|nr:MBL fold metallo-hydrolase [Candidatus Bipolaricaulota bacterium]
MEVAPGIYLVDACQFGRPGVGGVYVIVADQVALVESGTSLSKDRVLAALDGLGIPRDKVRWIFLTHIHLDHAGGAGALLPHLPRARVVVHPRGAEHLVDPSRLVESVRAAVKERFPLYGEAIPIPEERIHEAQDGDRFHLGGRTILALDSPGHAPHHLCFLEEKEGLLFTGDAAGLLYGDLLVPATVPPSFDLEASLSTLDRLYGLKPKALFYTHFGPKEGREGLSEYGELLRWWVGLVEGARDRVGEGLEAEVLGELGRAGWPVEDPMVREDLSMSVRGVLAYLRRRAR